MWWMVLRENGRSVCAIFGDGNPKERPKEKPKVTKSRVEWQYGRKYMIDKWGHERWIYDKIDLRYCAKPRRTGQKPVDSIYYDSVKNMNEA